MNLSSCCQVNKDTSTNKLQAPMGLRLVLWQYHVSFCVCVCVCVCVCHHRRGASGPDWWHHSVECQFQRGLCGGGVWERPTDLADLLSGGLDSPGLVLKHWRCRSV